MQRYGFDKRKQVLTRKEHKCTGCLETIPKGNMAVYHTGKYDEEYYSYHLHMGCHQFLVKHKEHFDGIWDGCVNDIKKTIEELISFD